MRKFSWILGVVASLSFLSPAYAWDGMVTGTIQSYHLVTGQPGNYEFRVFVSGQTTLCTGGADWAWVNSNEANYQTLVAAIISAKAQGSTVTIYTNLSYGHCHIGYVVVY